MHNINVPLIKYSYLMTIRFISTIYFSPLSVIDEIKVKKPKDEKAAKFKYH
jgi:hypothetical protein